jgi:isoquinoline 1-oxidoreductase beta subunit
MAKDSIRLSRRNLLKGAAGLVVGVYLAPAGKFAQAATATPGTPFAPNAFVRVGADHSVTVLIKHIEFGQGPFTGLSTLVAEEMDADWAQMRAEHAPANAQLYNNLQFGPMQGTGGSNAIAESHEQMRKAGATARALLVQAAAQEWKVSPSEITVDKGVIAHAASKRSGQFGDFATAASKLPVPTEVALKDPANFKLIGKEGAVKRLDSAAKSAGRARFSMDVYEPDMLTVVVAHAPSFGARVTAFDATAALKVRGVVAVKQVPTGVAVYAEGMWPAIKARRLLDITWDESASEKRGSGAILEHYRSKAGTTGVVAGSHGDIAKALENSERTLTRDYAFPYLAHAPMEPLDGFLRWDGTTAKAAFGSQIQTLDQGAIAGVLGIDPAKVELETLFAGGSFGRRAQPAGDFAAELASVAKAFGTTRPVKLVWTREDDIQGGRYRPMFLHRLQGGIRDGKIVAWKNTVVGHSFIKGSPFEPMMIKNGVDATMVEGAAEIPYRFDDFLCEVHMEDIGVPGLWWRSVGGTHTGYAVECFIDELLQETGQDPIAGRIALLGEDQRFASVLNAVAKLCDWKGPEAKDGRARGVAVTKAFNTYVAQIAEVSLGDNGEPKVHKVWCAVDCGVVVNPDIVRAQMEGGIGYGLGHILYGEITLADGRPVQKNFDGYRSLRINEMPAVEVAIVNSALPPTGVGEPGVPPIGPAVANALARLGRERPQQLPMVKGAV